MGAHTIGACNRSNSGYAGTWITGGARAFDNEYYKVMLDDSSSTSWITEVRADISCRYVPCATSLRNGNPCLQDKANARAADRKWQFEGYDSDGEQVKHSVKRIS